MDIVSTCPFGSKCEEAKDGALHRCAWFTEVKGSDPQTGDSVNEWKCAVAWLPMIGLENNKNALSGVAATEQVRNILADMKGG